MEYLQHDFGVTPVFIRPGGGEFSPSWVNHTGCIAAQLGFGLTRLATPYYLGRDRVIALGPVPQIGWAYDKQLSPTEVPWTVDGPVFLAFHDRDVAMDKSAVERLLSEIGGGVRFMTAAEYCAYLHAEIEPGTAEADKVSLVLNYDDHYCQYFASHASAWTLHLSDETRNSWKAPEKQTVIIPKGLGRHVVRAGAGGVVVQPAKISSSLDN